MSGANPTSSAERRRHGKWIMGDDAIPEDIAVEFARRSKGY